LGDRFDVGQISDACGREHRRRDRARRIDGLFAIKRELGARTVEAVGATSADLAQEQPRLTRWTSFTPFPGQRTDLPLNAAERRRAAWWSDAAAGPSPAPTPADVAPPQSFR